MNRPADLYTKIVLTVIAVALCVIAFRPLLLPRPAIADEQQVVDVNITQIAGGSISPITHGGLRPDLPVEVVNWP